MFFSMTFYIDKKERGIWTIRPAYRLAILGIFIIVFVSSVLSFFELQRLHSLQGLFMLLLSAGLLYRDCCIFDGKMKRVFRKSGIAFFVKEECWSFDEIGNVCITQLYRGNNLFEIQCGLRAKDGTGLLDIEHVKKREKEALEQRGKQAASYIGCPLEYIRM